MRTRSGKVKQEESMSEGTEEARGSTENRAESEVIDLSNVSHAQVVQDQPSTIQIDDDETEELSRAIDLSLGRPVDLSSGEESGEVVFQSESFNIGVIAERLISGLNRGRLGQRRTETIDLDEVVCLGADTKKTRKRPKPLTESDIVILSDSDEPGFSGGSNQNEILVDDNDDDDNDGIIVQMPQIKPLLPPKKRKREEKTPKGGQPSTSSAPPPPSAPAPAGSGGPECMICFESIMELQAAGKAWMAGPSKCGHGMCTDCFAVMTKKKKTLSCPRCRRNNKVASYTKQFF